MMNSLVGLALMLSAVLGPGYVPQTDAPVFVEAFPQRSQLGATFAYVPFSEPKVIIIQPWVFADLQMARHVLAHEEGHLLYGNSEKTAEAYACEVEPTRCGYLLTE